MGTPLKVAVIGAGIGGTATAIGLHRAGADVTVFERAAGPRHEGAGLSLFGNGLAALDVLGVGPAIRAAGAPASQLRAGYRRPGGGWLTRMPDGAFADLRVVHRRDLQDLLLAALPPGTVRYGTAVTAVSADGRSVTVDDGTGAARTELVDVVVAADGLHSGTRAHWPGDPGVRYSGYSAWRGVTGRAVDLRGAAGETLGRGLRFGIAPLVDGRVYWFAVVTTDAGVPFDDEYSAVRERFGRWHAPIPELIAATPPDAVFRLDIHELAGRLPGYRRGRCVLLGDAAHAMTPDLGQGGNQALEDAATLVRLLTPTATAEAGELLPTGATVLEAALREYDRLRRRRTQSVARLAGRIGSFMQAPTRTAAVTRNIVLRLLPSRLGGARAAVMHRWQPPPLSSTVSRRADR
jgi:2-polyprenyl-6-methoxyphenol hydroxylase-like FAD-dependent oxidoreductase